MQHQRSRRARFRSFLALAITAGTLARPATAHSEPAAEGTAKGTSNEELIAGGLSALKAGRLEEARDAFAAAWRRQPETVVTLALAEVEMRLGRFVDAAEHWQYLVAHLPVGSAREREAARDQLDICRSHVGALTLKVEPDGATVLIDDEPVGSAPLARELFLEPGRHRVRATISSRTSDERPISISAGSRLSLSLRVPSAAPEAQTPHGRAVAPAAPVIQPDAAQPPAHASRLRTPVLIASAALAASSAALGIYWLTRHGVAADEAGAARATAEAGAPPSAPRNSICYGPERPTACDSLVRSVRDADRFHNLAVGAFVTAGVFGAATIAGLMIWKSPSPTGEQRISIAPLLGMANGVELAGRF
jgi:hypothetical protein